MAGDSASWRRWPTPAAVLAVCAASTLTLGLAAREGEGAVPVFERPRPDYDPKGIDLGGFRLFPGAAVTEGYDDNIFADDSDAEADLITSVAASLVMESQWSRHHLTVEGRVRYQAFLDNSDQDRTEFLLRPSLRLDLPERSQANLSAEYSRRVVGRDDPEDSGDQKPTEFDRFETRAEVIARANRTFFGLNGQVRRDDYLAGSDNDRDRTEYRVGVPLGYEISAKTDITLEPFFRWRDFDEVDSSGADRDARAAGATVGIDTEITSLVHLDFDIGFIANDFEDTRFNDSVDLIFGGEIVWYATALTTAKARAERHDISTSQTGASSKTQTTVDLEVQHEVRRNVLLGAQASYINDDFRDIDRNDDRGIVGISAQYLVNNYASLVANYRYEQRWSDAADEDFSRNIVTLGLRTRF